MNRADVDVVALEAISARAWPAAREASIGGWRLHATDGFSGRINACWPLGHPERPVSEAVAAVQAWYAAERLPAVFKIVDGHCFPAGLIERLSDEGYAARTETVMMIGPAIGRTDPLVRIGASVDPDFQSVFSSTAEDPGDTRERLDTLSRIPAPRALARLDIDGRAAAIGASAAEGEWAGLFAMRTDPAHRRKGLGRRVLATLLDWAAGTGARRVWLQVEADNAPAIALYEAAGFVEAYRYRYWRRPEAA